MSDSPELSNIPVSAELLLAVILKNVGEIEIPINDFMNDYAEYQIGLGQDRDGYVVIELIGPDNESR